MTVAGARLRYTDHSSSKCHDTPALRANVDPVPPHIGSIVVDYINILVVMSEGRTFVGERHL